MMAPLIGLILGAALGAFCRWFDIPSPAPPRLTGAALLVAMTLGFLLVDALLPPGQTLISGGPGK